MDFSLLETSADLNNSMIFLGQKTPSPKGWEHEGTIFNRLLLSLFKGQRPLIAEQASLLGVTLNKCCGVQEAPVLNILSSIVRMDQGESECKKHPGPQWPDKHMGLLIFVIRIRNHGTSRGGSVCVHG